LGEADAEEADAKEIQRLLQSIGLIDATMMCEKYITANQ